MPASSQQRFLDKLFSGSYSQIGARRAIEKFRWPADVAMVAGRVADLWFTSRQKYAADVSWLESYEAATAPAQAKAASKVAKPTFAPKAKAKPAQVAAPVKAAAAPRGRPAKVPAKPAPAVKAAAQQSTRPRTVPMLDKAQEKEVARWAKDSAYQPVTAVRGVSSRSRAMRPAELEMLTMAVEISAIAKNTAEGLQALGEPPESDACRTAHQALIWSADWLQFFRSHILTYMQKEGMISEADLVSAQASLSAEAIRPISSSKPTAKAPRVVKAPVAEEEEEEEADEADADAEDEDEDEADAGDEEEASPESAEGGDEEEGDEDEEGTAEAAAALEDEDGEDEDAAAESISAPRPPRAIA